MSGMYGQGGNGSGPPQTGGYGGGGGGGYVSSRDGERGGGYGGSGRDGGYQSRGGGGRDYQGGDRGGRGVGGGRGPSGRDGDWPCPNTSCGNVNFARRTECNKCGAPSPGGSAGGGGGGNRGEIGGGYGDSGGGRSGSYEGGRRGGGGSYGSGQGLDDNYGQVPPPAPAAYGESGKYPPPVGGNGSYASGNYQPPASYTGGPAGYPPSYGAPAAGYGGASGGRDSGYGGGRGAPPAGRDSGYSGGGGGSRDSGYVGGRGGPPAGRDSGYSGGGGGGRDSGYGVGGPRQSSGGGGYGGSAPESTDDVKQCDENCGDLCDNSRIYISNLPKDVTIDELKDLFGGIGQIARIKQKRGYKDQWPYNIKLYTDDQGNSKGDGVLSYEDPSAAHSAGGFYNNYELRGHKISVTMAAKSAPKAPAEYGRGGGGRGGYGGGGDRRRDNYRDSGGPDRGYRGGNRSTPY